LPHVGSGKKNEVAVVVLSFIPQTVMPKVLQCDLESIKKLLATLEGDPASEATIDTVQVRMITADPVKSHMINPNQY
jgi:hypothetical protein